MPMRMSGDCFRVVTPVCLMTVGSMGRARLTRFSTRTCAMFTSIPCSKVTFNVYEPSLVQYEDMYIMPSTPLTCCSMGAAIDSATSLALAPGYWQRTDTEGGEICGNWASGKLKAAMPPARVMKMDNTEAKIGRSMKKREITIGSPEEEARTRRSVNVPSSSTDVPPRAPAREHRVACGGPASTHCPPCRIWWDPPQFARERPSASVRP